MKINKEFHEKIINSLIVASFFSLTVFLFAPLHLYFTNISELRFSFSDVCYYLAAITAFSIFLLLILSIPWKFTLYKKLISLLFILSVLVWFQGNILVWDYGSLDGRFVDWKKYYYRGVIDTGIWILFICVAFKMPSVIYKAVRKLSVAFILIQLISISFILITMPEIPSFKKYSLDENTKFAFSAKKNVIILVIDAFQADVFQEIIGEGGRYKNIFKGFTYFRNSVSGFPTTFPSVPLILTGQYYDNSIPMQEFMKKAFCSSSVTKFLKDNGFEVDLFPWSYKCIYFNEKTASNIVKRRKLSKNSAKKATSTLYSISMFRYMPHFIKNYVHNSVARLWMDSNGIDDFGRSRNFIKKMIYSSNADIEKYVFKFYHLEGLHTPFNLNERLEYESLPLNRVGYKRQAKGMLRLAELFLDKLDKLGIYDDSMIFIIGDHGYGDLIGVNVPENLKAKDIRPIHPEAANAKKGALPLILIKPFNSKGELWISDAPVCLSDIPKTIASELDLKNDFSGDSMFKVKESDIRERRFLLCNAKPNYSRNGFLPSIKEYVVSGFSWLDESWRPTGRYFNPPAQKWLYYFIYGKPDLNKKNGRMKDNVQEYDFTENRNY